MQVGSLKSDSTGSVIRECPSGYKSEPRHPRLSPFRREFRGGRQAFDVGEAEVASRRGR